MMADTTRSSWNSFRTGNTHRAALPAAASAAVHPLAQHTHCYLSEHSHTATEC